MTEQQDRTDGCAIGCNLAARFCPPNDSFCRTQGRMTCSQRCRGEAIPDRPTLPPPCPRCDEYVHGCLFGCERSSLSPADVANCRATCLNVPSVDYPIGFDAHCRNQRALCPQTLSQNKLKRNQAAVQRRLTGPRKAFSLQRYVNSDYFKVFMR